VIASVEQLKAEWTTAIAPRRGDILGELLEEAAAFLGISLEEARDRARDAGERFRAEWRATAPDPSDDRALTRFYNQSDTELFELINWHASDPIHYRTIILRDFAAGFPGRELIDYGSGIGNDALVFGQAGFQVTLADISDPLLAFAAWRCRSRGLKVRTIDLKTSSPEPRTFDMAVCFDVLEHIPRPLTIVRQIRASLNDGGLFAFHAPFGPSADHPMHVVHRDVVTPRMRSLGFEPLSCPFPSFVRAPMMYRKRQLPALDRLAYFVYDGYLDGSVGSRLAAMYRAGRSMIRVSQG
jgi:SAM-dependent methyltransferase